MDLDHVFAYHAPTPGQVKKYHELREAAKFFAAKILELVPPGADRADALRKVREAVMTANAGIALRGRTEQLTTALHEREWREMVQWQENYERAPEPAPSPGSGFLGLR